MKGQWRGNGEGGRSSDGGVRWEVLDGRLCDRGKYPSRYLGVSWLWELTWAVPLDVSAFLVVICQVKACPGRRLPIYQNLF